MTAADRFAERSGSPVLNRMWWAVLLRAIAVLAFGIAVFFVYRDSLQMVARSFAAYAALDGVLSIIAARLAGGFGARPGLTLAGVVSILGGIAAGAWSPLTIPTLAIIIGLWGLATGVIEFAAALKLRQVMERDWSLVGIAALSVVLGLILLIVRDFELDTLVRVLGGYTLIVGALMLVLSVRFKRGFRP